MKSKLLLVADDHYYREMLQIRFEAIGYHVDFPQTLEDLKNPLPSNLGHDRQRHGFQSFGHGEITGPFKTTNKPRFFLHGKKRTRTGAPLEGKRGEGSVREIKEG